MRITPKILAQGQGVLQLTVSEYNLVFLDTFKFFPQKLDSLPARFQIERFKGYHAFSWNPPQNWGRIRKHPPPVHDYINDRDSEKTKAEKTKWWVEVKNKMDHFDFSRDCMQYCLQDVIVLMASTLKFLTQTFQFGCQMIERFGVSPAYRPGLTQPHFHLLTKATPTLGSYA